MHVEAHWCILCSLSSAVRLRLKVTDAFYMAANWCRLVDPLLTGHTYIAFGIVTPWY